MIRIWMLGVLAIATSTGADVGGWLSKTTQLGPVKAIVALSPKKPTIGDEITLEIRVEAKADVEVLMPEFGEALERYTIIDFVPKRRIDTDGQSVFVQRYTLQPYLSGDQSIPPILIEFVDHRPGHKPAPKDADAYEMLTERIDFHVKSVLPASASSELNPPLGRLELKSTRATSIWAWGISGAVLAALAVVVGLVVMRSRRRRARRRSAYEIARSRLDQLLAGALPKDEPGIEDFFVAISSIVRHYLEDRFGLRAPELTTEEFMTLAGSSRDLSADHRSMLQDFLRQADLVKFAGLGATENEIRLSSDLAIRFLEETRENAPLIEDTLSQPDADRAVATRLPGQSQQDSRSKEDANV